MIDHLLTETVVITPRSVSSFDDAGNEVLADGATTTTVGFWQQDAEDDDRLDQDQATTLGWLFLPAGTTIDRNDRAAVAGLTLEVVGRPRTPTRPNLGAHHTEVRCRLVEG